MSEGHENIPGKIIPNHEYDGIQELDNPLPKWWLYIFWGTIIFSIAYYAYYEIGSGPSLEDEFVAAKTNHQQQFAVQQDDGSESSIDWAAMAEDQNAIANGQEKFQQFCSPCHQADGGGSIGPNLTDDYWLVGDGQGPSVYQVIYDGLLDKGMPAWGPTLGKTDVTHLAAFVLSLRGTNPAAPKEPQGENFAETPKTE